MKEKPFSATEARVNEDTIWYLGRNILLEATNEFQRKTYKTPKHS